MAEVRINKFEEKLVQSGDKVGAIDSMIIRFNRLVQASGVLKELKKYESYEKPSVARSRKRRIKLIKSRQQERKNAVYQRRRKKTIRPHTRLPDSSTSKARG